MQKLTQVLATDGAVSGLRKRRSRGGLTLGHARVGGSCGPHGCVWKMGGGRRERRMSNGSGE